MPTKKRMFEAVIEILHIKRLYIYRKIDIINWIQKMQ